MKYPGTTGIQTGFAPPENTDGEAGSFTAAPLPQLAQFRALLDAIPDPAFMKNRDLQYIYINNAGATTWGLRPEAVLGRRDDELFSETSARRITAVDTRILETGAHMELEEYVTGRQGETWCYASIKGPLRDEQGAIVGILGFSRNITEARRLAEALKERVKEKRTLYEVIRRLAELDLPFEERLAHVVRCLPPGWLYPARTAARITFEETTCTDGAFDEGHWLLSSPIRRFDARVGAVDISVAPSVPRETDPPFLPEERELLDCVANAIGEASERRRLEEQFFQAQKMESIGRLAGGVAHDFNNILGVILGHSELLMETMPPGSLEFDDLTQIHEAAQRAAGLTRQLLAFSRQEVAQPTLLDMNDAVTSMLRMLGRMLGEDVELVWHPTTDPMMVRVDPVQFQQILANLVVNARDAINGSGRIIIESSLRSLDTAYCVKNREFQPGDYVVLSVSDTGSGIPKEQIPLIFEPFYTTKERGKGTGLGLATVYGIVKQNGGFIQVYSEPGRGTTFGVYLPRQTGQAGFANAETALDAASPATETVLLVEDDQQLLELHTKSITSLGYHVIPSDSPSDALEQLQRLDAHIDLLVTDIIMPQMNGFELFDAIARLRPGTACLFTSGYTVDAIAERGVLTDRMHFIQKPFSRGALAEKMRQALRDRDTNDHEPGALPGDGNRPDQQV